MLTAVKEFFYQHIPFLNFPHSKWMIALTLILLGWILVFVWEKIILNQLRCFFNKTSCNPNHIVISALSKKALLWCLLIASYVGIRMIPMPHSLEIAFHKGFVSLLIVIGAWLISNMLVELIKNYTNHIEAIIPTASIFNNLSRIFIFMIAVLVILQYLGISIAPILTALGVGGLAVALGLQDTLSNLFAGLAIIISKQIKPGDYIKLDMGEEGHVADITWRNTTIKQLSNNMLVIPNSKIASSIITNYDMPSKESIIKIPLSVSYTSNLDHVEKVTLQTAKSVLSAMPHHLSRAESLIRYHQFGDFSIQFFLLITVSELSDQILLKHTLIKALHTAYQKEHIEIPYPTHTIYTTHKTIT